MSHPDLPLATPAQFRAAVRQITNRFGHQYTYTDKPHNIRKGKFDDGKRYVAILSVFPTEEQVKSIEFVLWASGVTAHTRAGHRAVRGTCRMQPKVKNGKQDS